MNSSNGSKNSNMGMDDLDKFIGNENLSVSEAMRKIDANSYGILFLVNPSAQLTACLSDGDIRRFLLKGGNLNNYAIEAANHNPKFAHNEAEAKKLYDRRNCISVPIIDGNRRIVDIYNGNGVRKKASLGIPVVINAGGKGTRLDPFTRVLPKPLIPIGDLPIIELIMKEYQSYACNDFHIIVNYKRELMKAYFSDKEKDGDWTITWYDEETPLGTGGGLSLLRHRMADTFFFANCDALLTANYESMIRFHKENKNVVTMICSYKNVSIPYGIVEMGMNGVFEGIKEKPNVSFLTNTGIYIVEPEVINNVKDNEVIGFPDIVEREKGLGKKVGVFPVSESDWMDMGQLPELEKMRRKLYGE